MSASAQRRKEEACCRRKRRFTMKVKAEVHAMGVMNHPVAARRAPVPIHVYLCPVCDGWHLTRRPQATE